MDHLKEGIYLRGYGQKDPRHEYRREGFTLFTAMLDARPAEVLMQLFRVDLVDEEAVASAKRRSVSGASIDRATPCCPDG